MTAENVFSDPRIKPWRKLDGRDNAVLELLGQRRLHVKRYQGGAGVRAEVAGIERLRRAGVPTMALASWGELSDGRSFVMTEDLAGYESCQAILREGGSFSELAGPTAKLAAQLHAAGLHHRDLYLCHFFLRRSDGDCRLIDVARVGELPRIFPRRWIVKDLGQFLYSTREFGVPKEETDRWFLDYAGGDTARARSLAAAAARKADAIARHDARLREREPTRNISIPNGARS